MTSSPRQRLDDQAQRDCIETALDETLLVEAAAGTGKTTSMVNRMVRLLGDGVCKVDTLAAVTFTRKATAELRDRFQLRLEQAVQAAQGVQRERLEKALETVEQCFIGTIHSFCARLLRERPIEAGIDVAFTELDEDEEHRLRRVAWDEHVAHLHASDDPILATLDELGLGPADLRGAYLKVAGFADVQDWPVPDGDFDDALAAGARRELRAYADYMETVAPDLPTEAGNDTLMPFFREFPRRLRNTRIDENRALVGILEDIASLKVVQKQWPQGKTQGRAELDRLEAFVEAYAAPLVENWRQCRYGRILDLLHGAVRRYDAMRTARGVLSYQDLLMEAADLLRGDPDVRTYFRARFTHLLVDEFQDTDPVQAEVMLLLTAKDPQEKNWRKCRPVPGALFVVGDPKQAIYRFRRADLSTYIDVRRIFERCGRIVALTANFRSVPQLVKWFNGASADLFPKPDYPYSPGDSPMDPARPGGHDGDLTGVTALPVPGGLAVDEAAEYEADAIARLIRDAIDRRLTVPRTPRELDGGAPPHAVPGDFLILTRARKRLSVYARALQAVGLPAQVTGGAAVNELDEVSMLHTVLAAAVETDDPVALVGALRSEVFGISDTMLYRFRKAGGVFNIFVTDDVPDAAGLEPVIAAKERLAVYANWMTTLQPLAAVERIAGDVGLFALAASGDEGCDRAGGLCKAIELLRSASRESWTAADLVRGLRRMVDSDDPEWKRYDAVPLRPHDEPAVRVMNLHQAKGLEAPVVFLADATDIWRGGVDLHIDRQRNEPTRGYLQLRRQLTSGRGRGRVLAEPADWATRQQKERRFQDAEEDRLLYVAATRAASRLVISRPPGRQRWGKLAGHIAEDNFIDAVPDVAPPPVPTLTLPADAPRLFAERIGERWAERCVPTYDVQQVKTLSVKGAMPTAHPGEHGTEWGSVLHLLLEAAMVGSGGDLEPLAASALDERGLDPRDAPDAVELVRSVMGSDLWTRARAGTRCLTEVPIQFLQSRTGPDVPTIVRGVIDLVFRETDGWVIVDYKTDDHSPDAIDGLVEHYAGQVLLYADAWQRAVEEPVCETGLYFVRTGRYRPVTQARTAPAGA